MKIKKLGLIHYIGLALIILAGGYIILANVFAPQEQAVEANSRVILETNFGQIELELFNEKAPRTVENFLELAGEGFYDGTRFHRVIANFMIQGGCPNTRDTALKYAWGTGNPGYKFNCEIHDENFNIKGTISMANAGPNTNGSQFFINVANNDRLNSKHTVFGKVVSGMDVVLKISVAETGRGDIPVQDVIIESVKTDL